MRIESNTTEHVGVSYHRCKNLVMFSLVEFTTKAGMKLVKICHYSCVRARTLQSYNCM